MKNEAAMEEVKAFNAELQSLYETRPPVSKAKMTDITKRAMKGVKLYKHVVHAVEKFIHKCKAEYKVPGLYVIDSIVRQSRHQFGVDKDVFAPRFQKNIKNTFLGLVKCPDDQRPKIVRVLNLWQKNGVFSTDTVQMLQEVVAHASRVQSDPIRNGDDEVIMEDSTAPIKIPITPTHIKEQSKENKPTFDRKLLDFDYGEEEEDKQAEATHHIPPEPPRVEDVQKIANVLDPSMFESIQKVLAQGVGQQMMKPDMSGMPEMAMSMVPGNHHMIPSPFGLAPMMIANPFAPPPPMPAPSHHENEQHAMDRKDEDLRNKDDPPRRRRSRSPRKRSRSKSRSPSRRRRSRERRRDRSHSGDREHERDRLSKGLPPLKRGHISLCSSTLWIGHISKATTEPDVEATFGEYGKILSIDIIPPRGCAYICMDRRQDAYRTLLNKRTIRLRGSGSRIKLAWAPHKGAKNHKDFKDYWDVEQGCYYIPEEKMSLDVDLVQLEDGGTLDIDSLPEALRKKYEQVKKSNDPKNAPNAPSAPPVSLPSGIPLPFGVHPFMPQLGAPASGNPLTMLGMPPLGMPQMMLPGGMMRAPVPQPPPPQGAPPLPNQASPALPQVPISRNSPSVPVSRPNAMPTVANGEMRPTGGPPSFGPQGPRGMLTGPMPPQLRAPMGQNMPPMGGMPPRHMIHQGPGSGAMLNPGMRPQLPPRGPMDMKNGPDGPRMESMPGPPGFGMPGPPDFMSRHPLPPNWNGPQGPNWRHRGMRPDFSRGPPPNFNMPPRGMGGMNFPNGGPMGMISPRMGPPLGPQGGLVPSPSMVQATNIGPPPASLPPASLPPLAAPLAGITLPEKRPLENAPRTERKRERRSRWSDAPEDAPIVPPPKLLESVPEVVNAPAADEPGTPVADEAESPQAPEADPPQNKSSLSS